MTIEQAQRPADGDILSCGHAFHMPEDTKRTGSGSSGYAVTIEGHCICYSCADDWYRAELLTADRAGGYLAKAAAGMSMRITTWTGGHLARLTEISKTPTNFGGHLWRFRAIDVHGQHWYGTSPGPDMYVRMRKNKRQPLRTCCKVTQGQGGHHCPICNKPVPAKGAYYATQA